MLQQIRAPLRVGNKNNRDVLPIHPVADMFPLMQGAEFDQLVADIKQHGLRERIVTYDDKIIDGRNRALACEKAGVEPQYRPFQGEPKDVVPFIISANIHRRHLTAEQKRELIAKVLAANPEKSDRALADQMKVDKNVVSRIRKKVEATGASAPVEKRTGKDGKARKQPARNRAQSKPAKAKAPSRPGRWSAALTAASDALGELQELQGEYESKGLSPSPSEPIRSIGWARVAVTPSFHTSSRDEEVAYLFLALSCLYGPQ
jgi:hypothetical protein